MGFLFQNNMANLHAAAAAAAQAQAVHQVAATTKAAQAAAVAAAASGTEPITSTGAAANHPSTSVHNASAVGQFLANPTPLPPLHSGTHHPTITSHHPHHMYFPGAPPPPTPAESSIGCNSSSSTGIPPVAVSAATALSSLV